MILSIRIIRQPAFRLENCAKRTLTGVSTDEMIESLLVPKISFVLKIVVNCFTLYMSWG